jgi:serine/threonine-protein kinase RsbT
MTMDGTASAPPATLDLRSPEEGMTMNGAAASSSATVARHSHDDGATTDVASEGEVRIASESDIVTARKIVRAQAAALGFGVTDVTRIVTAASELTRNIYRYAGCGFMRWRCLYAAQDAGLELVFADEGPGIADVDKALESGYTTGNGLGMGLPGAKRLMDELEVCSEVGKGTTITARKWMRSA